jgi:hypothetical protein
MGGLPYFNSHGYSGFSLHAEFESAFKRTPFLTSGPRIDFITSNNNNNYSLILAYDLKLYTHCSKNPGGHTGDHSSALKPAIFHARALIPIPATGLPSGHCWDINTWLKTKYLLRSKLGMPFLRDSKTYHYSFANIKVGLKL